MRIAIFLITALLLGLSSCLREENPDPIAVINSFLPATGRVGDVVTISGENLPASNVAQVFFVKDELENEAIVQNSSKKELSIKVPSLMAGEYLIRIKYKKTTVTSTEKFFVIDSLSIITFTPDSGFSGNSKIVVTGTGFASSASVLLVNQLGEEIGGLNVNITSDKSLSFDIPELLPGDYTVRLKKDSETVTGSKSFKVNLPVLASLSSSLIDSGHGTLTITGNGFSKTNENNRVSFERPGDLSIPASVTQSGSEFVIINVPNCIANTGYQIKLITGISPTAVARTMISTSFAVRPYITSSESHSFNNRIASNTSFVLGNGFDPLLTNNKVVLIDKDLFDSNINQDITLQLLSMEPGKLNIKGGPYTSTEVYGFTVEVNGVASGNDLSLEIFDYPKWTTLSPAVLSIGQSMTVSGSSLDRITIVKIKNISTSFAYTANSILNQTATGFTIVIPDNATSGTYTVFVDTQSPLLNRQLKLNWTTPTLTVN